MVFRITNYCNMGCCHCMEESTTKGEHASLEMIDKMIKFAQSSAHTKTIQISGGEPTSHPELSEILTRVLSSFSKNVDIFLLSNGEFLADNKAMSDLITYNLYNHPNLHLQITSVPGLYPTDKFQKIKDAVALWENDPVNAGVRQKFLFESNLSLGVIPVGRALRNREAIEKTSYFAERSATSCFNLYNAFQHFDGKVFDAIEHVKIHSKTSLCKPLITEKGLVKFGEYDACTDILNLSSLSINDIDENIKMDLPNVKGPCGSCISNENQVHNLQKHLRYKSMLGKIK